jgi:hypothetical protein
MSDVVATNPIVFVPKRKLIGAVTSQLDPAYLQTSFPGLTIGLAKITTAMIQDLAVTSAKINDLAVTNAKIDALAVTDAKITSLSVTKLTAGNLTVIGTITTGKWVTGAAGTNRIEIDANYIAGYNSSNVLQFYLSAATGKAYAGAGAVVLDTAGITINGQVLAFKCNTTTVGYLYANLTTELLLYSNNDLCLQSVDTTLLLAGGLITIQGDGIKADSSKYMDFPQYGFDPSASECRIYYNFTTHTFKFHNGTEWKTIATV